MSAAARRGIPFVVAAPSGTGKTTVCRMVVERDPGIRFSISHTTRPPRPGERDGFDYHFVTSAEFRRLVDEGAFLEHAEYAGRLYGTSWRSLQEPLEAGSDLLLEIEVQGARQVRERLSEARLIFLLPPSMKELEARLRKRASDPEEAVQQRLAVADRELAEVGIFDYAVVNDDLEQAVADVLELVRAEREGRGAALRERHGREAVLARWRGAQAEASEADSRRPGEVW
jgi:guanylate kinase